MTKLKRVYHRFLFSVEPPSPVYFMLQSGSGMEFEEESKAPVYATLGVSLCASCLNLFVDLFVLSFLENSWISKG